MSKKKRDYPAAVLVSWPDGDRSVETWEDWIEANRECIDDVEEVMMCAGIASIIGSGKSEVVCFPLHLRSDIDALTDALAEVAKALEAVLPYAVSRGEDLVAAKAAGNEDGSVQGADEATSAIEYASKLLERIRLSQARNEQKRLEIERRLEDRDASS